MFSQIQSSIDHFLIRSFASLGLCTAIMAQQMVCAQSQQTEKLIPIDQQTKTQAIQKLCTQLREKYVFPEVAERTIKLIQGKLKQGAYANYQDHYQFARALSQDLRATTNDKHLAIWIKEEVIPVEESQDMRSEAEKHRDEEQELQQEIEHLKSINYGVKKIEQLPGNVAYLDFRGFGPTDLVAPYLSAAMQMIHSSDALIIDLRNNHGGSPDTVSFLVSYFTEPGVHLNDIYIRSENSTTQKWSWPATPTPRYDAKKKVYVLTSAGTFSAAEDFSYTMQALKRSTTIGETTGGGAHPVRGERLSDHLLALIPFGRSINPITKTNWEGVGVIPEIKTSAEQALSTAHRLALETLLKTELSDERKELVERALRDLAK